MKKLFFVIWTCAIWALGAYTQRADDRAARVLSAMQCAPEQLALQDLRRGYVVCFGGSARMQHRAARF